MSRAPGDELPVDDAGLARVWREASREEPPAALDDAIRAAARKAVHAHPHPAAGSPFGGRWRVPLSVAAVLVVSATVTLLVAERERDASRASHDRAVPPAGAPEAYSVESAPGPPKTPARAFGERGAPAPVTGIAPRERESARAPQEERKAQSPAPQPPLVSAQKRAQPAAEPVRQMPLQEAPSDETDRREGQPAEAQQAGAASVAPAAAPPVPRADDALRDQAAAEAAKLTKRAAEPAPGAKERAPAKAPAAPTAMEPGAQNAPAPKSEPQAFPAAPQTNASAEGAVAAGAESLEPKAWLERILELRRQGKREEAAKSLKAFRERYPAYPLPAELNSPP